MPDALRMPFRLPAVRLTPSLMLAVLVAPAAWAGVPTTRSQDDVRGRELYEDHCWQCHGPAGLGDGPLAASLSAPLASLRGRQDRSTWPALVDRIQDGRGDMPAFAEVMDRPDSRRILVWLEALDGESVGKDLQPTRGRPAPPPDEEDDTESDEAASPDSDEEPSEDAE